MSTSTSTYGHGAAIQAIIDAWKVELRAELDAMESADTEQVSA